MLVTSVLLYLSYDGMLVALWPFAFIKCVCVYYYKVTKLYHYVDRLKRLSIQSLELIYRPNYAL